MAGARAAFDFAAHATGLTVNLLLCFALIPAIGARGAAAASLASYAIEVAVITRFFRRQSFT